jgi:L-threonylcarbamoyladenylate synthase
VQRSVQPIRISQAVRILAAGGIMACPTEAVWGLSCDPASEAAVTRLLSLKQRPVEKGLILVAANMRQFDWLLRDLDKPARAKLKLSWPGPTTWLVPHRGRVPAWVCGEFDSVALRVTAHPTMVALCTAFGGPLISTSANTAGAQPAREQFQLWRYFGDALDGVVPGRLGGNTRPSVIRDLESDTIIRPG